MNDSPTFTAVCIAGMHRSGTSMVARLLQAVGLYLGPDEQLAEGQADNPDGFWENIRAVSLNEAILASFGGAWDFPPDFPPAWVDSDQVRPYRKRAIDLANQLRLSPVFGWKDPRSSLTFPLWRAVLPGLKAVICVRNPLEVALSLRERNLRSSTAALDLWLRYNTAILGATNPADRVVVHFETMLENPARELRRVAGALGLQPAETEIESAVGGAQKKQRHFQFDWQDLVELEVHPDVLACYRELLIEADLEGAGKLAIPERPLTAALIHHEALEAKLVSAWDRRRGALAPHTTLPDAGDIPRRRLRYENDQLTNTLRYYEQRIAELRAELAHVTAQRDWHAQDRDHVAALLAGAGGRLAALEDEIDRGGDRARELQRQLEQLERSKAVKLQRGYWAALQRLRSGRR